MKKVILVFTLLLTLILTMLVCMSAQSAVIYIDNADGIIALMNGTGDLSANYVLRSDIDLSAYTNQNPIGQSASKSFTGSFDGGEHTISGINISGGTGSAFFGHFSGSVRNLTIKGEITSNGTNDAGGLIAVAHANTTIENCTNECNVSGKNSVGGIIGKTDGNGTIRITKCINKGTINATREAGGIVGYANPKGTFGIYECNNYGSVSLTGSDERAGGILGACALDGIVRIEKCINLGNVSGQRCVGGIAGLFQGSDSVSKKTPSRILTECVNKAAITSTVTGKTARVGGVLGWAKNIGDINNSLNEGRVSSKAEHTGGFIGGTEGYVSIGYCFSRGSVSSTASGDYVGSFGGFMAYKPFLPNYASTQGNGKTWINVSTYAPAVFDTLNTNEKWVSPKAPELSFFHECNFGTKYLLGNNGCHTVCPCGKVSGDLSHVDGNTDTLCDRCGNLIGDRLERVYVTNGGEGNGKTKSSPIGSLIAAYNALGDDGGEIVLLGTVTVPLHELDSTSSSFTEPAHKGKITLQGENATLMFSGVYQYHLSGDTEFKNVTIASADASKHIDITARGNSLIMGDGITMRGCDLANDKLDTKILIAGGCRDGAFTDNVSTMDTSITVKSGQYYAIRGFHRLQVTHKEARVTSSGKATINIGGDVHVKYLVAGSGSESQFVYPAGADMHVMGDVTVYDTLSLGNQSSEVTYFRSHLHLEEGIFSFLGDKADFVTRLTLTEFNISVNPCSETAVHSYMKLFAGFGDSENTITRIPEKNAETTDLLPLYEGIYKYTNGKLRITVLSDSLVRIEESDDGAFNDASTLMAVGRDEFEGTFVATEKKNEVFIISTAGFTLNVPSSSQSASDVRIYDKSGKEIYNLFTCKKNAMYSELPMPADTPDALLIIDNGIIPPSGGLTYNGSTDDMSGWTRSKSIDTYAFIPMGDAKLLRADFVKLMGRTALSDIKTLGSWYSKWTTYTADEKLQMIEEYRERGIPLDMIVIDTEWKNTSANGNDGNGTGYEVNLDLYPDMEGFLSDANDAGVLVLFNDHTHKTSLDITDPTELKWQSDGINKLLGMGLDGWWYDRNWSYSLNSPYHDLLHNGTIGQVLYTDTMHKYHVDNAGEGYPLRTLLLSNTDWIKNTFRRGNPSLIGHRYGIQWTGDIFGDPLCLNRDLENMVLAGANGSSPYLSSDLGGFNNNDTVSEELFIRWMQYGAFSPVCRVHSNLGFENEHFPWSYGEYSEGIIKDYLNMRYNLMPYLYSIAYENYETGLPLARRLDFNYPQYEESQSNTQYTLGDDILVAPMWTVSGEGSQTVPSDWFDDTLRASFYRTNQSMRATKVIKGHLAKTVNVDDINFYLNKLAPVAEVDKETYAMRIEGSITPEIDCYLGVICDEGAHVYIDGELFIDAWAPEKLLQPNVNMTTPLVAGQTYSIEVEYYNGGGRGQLYLTYEPIVEANRSQREVFIPDGEWIDVFTGEIITGPATVTVTKTMEESPIYVRRGAVIPTSRVTTPITGGDFESLSLNVYGLGNGNAEVYEDDGSTEGYLEGDYRLTNISSSTKDGVTKINVTPAKGNFKTEYTERKLTVRIHSDTPIICAYVNGKTAEITRIDKDASALPFSECGASPISDVYEISYSANINAEHTIIVSTSPYEVPSQTGDIDGNNTVDNTDLTLLIRYLSGYADMTFNVSLADLDGNNKVDNRDAIELIKLLVNQETNN